MKALAIAVALLVIGCSQPAQVGLGNAVRLPPDSAATCSNLCGSIGLALDSVVVMADNVGCVCRAVPSAPAATPSASRAAPSGGMAAFLLQAAARKRSQTQTYQPRKPPASAPTR